MLRSLNPVPPACSVSFLPVPRGHLQSLFSEEVLRLPESLGICCICNGEHKVPAFMAKEITRHLVLTVHGKKECQSVLEIQREERSLGEGELSGKAAWRRWSFAKMG